MCDTSFLAGTVFQQRAGGHDDADLIAELDDGAILVITTRQLAIFATVPAATL